MYKFYYTNEHCQTSYAQNAVMKALQQVYHNPKLKKWLMRINLTCALLLIAFMQVSLAASAQKISMSKKNANLTELFKEIRKQTGYDFVLPKDLMKAAKPVTIQFSNAELEDVLEACFHAQPFTYEISNRMIIVSEKEKGFFKNLVARFQAIDVTGRIVNETGLPLSGATVKIKSTDRVTRTNEKGEFSFANVDEQAILEISYLGYKVKEIKAVPDLGTVQMELVIGKLDEVTVSTGYQRISKERATGSFSYVGQKTFNEQVGTTVLSRLEAVANGLMADRSTTTTGRLMIRGLSTIRGPKDVLVVLDNFPYEGNLDNLNPNDIENITILKDAAATSIWGARAGNGVVVIATKKGSYNQPLSVDFNINSTIIQKPDLYYLKQMSSADFIGVEEYLYKNGKYNAELGAVNMQGQTPIVEMLIQKDKGLLSQADYEAAKAGFSKIDIRDQYNKYLYQAGLNQQYALNLKGGSMSHAWSLSSGYDINSSTLSEKYNRFNLRFQNTLRPVKNLELTAGAYYIQSKSTSGKPGYGQITSRVDLYPYARFADDEGNPLSIMKNYRTGYIDTAGKGRLLDWKYYPLEDYKHTVVTQTISDVLINGGISYKLFKGFSADLKYQYERQQTSGRDLKDEQSFAARSMVNNFTQLPAGLPPIYKVPLGGILDLSNAVMQSNNVRGQLNYANQWDKHEVNIIAGAERRDARTVSEGNRTYGYNGEILTYGKVDYQNTYPNFISGTQNYIDDPRSMLELATRFLSTYANGSYAYDGKYTVSLSARRDASNLFGLNTNDQWTPLWSAGASWDLSKESFYHADLLPYMRLRATYGFSGNIDPSMTAVTTIRYNGTALLTPAPWAIFSNYYNPDLRWERSEMLNLGLDFSTKNSRISGSIDYFNKKGKDLFGNAQIDYTGGIGPTIIKNAARTSGNGIDLELNSLNLKQGNFSWSSNLNASYYKDKVVEYFLSNQQGSNLLNGSPALSALVGNPIYSVYSYKWAGLDPLNGNPRGYLNGQISSDYAKLTGSVTTVNDLTYHGSALPRFYGSFGNTFSYRGFSLTARLIYKLDYYFRKTSISYSNLYSNGKGSSDYANRWQKSGDELFTNVPPPIYPNVTARDSFYGGSEALVDRADHIRLQYINFTYNMSRSQYRFLPFKTMSVYVNAANLGVVWTANKDHIDPEYAVSGMLKPSRTFSIGIRADIN